MAANAELSKGFEPLEAKSERQRDFLFVESLLLFFADPSISTQVRTLQFAFVLFASLTLACSGSRQA